MVAFLMASLGIPMVHAGQDFLNSKGGEHNTYQKGEMNALDFQRIFRFPGTHHYFRTGSVSAFALGRADPPVLTQTAAISPSTSWRMASEWR